MLLQENTKSEGCKSNRLTELCEKIDQPSKSTLIDHEHIATMGYQADVLMASFRFSEEDGMKYGIVQDKFENHYKTV